MKIATALDKQDARKAFWGQVADQTLGMAGSSWRKATWIGWKTCWR